MNKRSEWENSGAVYANYGSINVGGDVSYAGTGDHVVGTKTGAGAVAALRASLEEFRELVPRHSAHLTETPRVQRDVTEVIAELDQDSPDWPRMHDALRRVAIRVEHVPELAGSARVVRQHFDVAVSAAG